LRGNIFWLTHGSGRKRVQISRETQDYADAVTKAREILAHRSHRHHEQIIRRIIRADHDGGTDFGIDPKTETEAGRLRRVYNRS
jgi:hypothetical protein